MLRSNQMVAQLLRCLRRTRQEFLGARDGAVAMIFALAAIPLFLLMGVAIDYSRATMAKSHLQSAVDAAALQVGMQPNLTSAQRQLLATNTVTANLGSSASGLNVQVTETDLGNGAWQVSAGGSVQSAIMKLAQIPSVQISATAQSSSQLTNSSGNAIKYINVHLLVDTSQSMGVGADETDRTGMSSSSLQCSFACHSGVASYTTSTDACRGPSQSVSIVDGVTYAHQQNFNLRIDVIKTALTNLITQAQTVTAANGQTIQIALYTFNNSFQTVQSLTNSYSSLTTAISTLDIAGASAGGGGGTSLQTALQQVQTQIGNNGDGTSSSAPLNYVVLISDGLYDNANPLANTYTPAPQPVCQQQCQCVDNWGNQCGGWQQGWDHDHNQCGGDYWQGCHQQCQQTCTTNYSGSTIVGSSSPGASNSLYNGNVGNVANASNVYNYALDANYNLLTGDQNNSDHWSVGAAQTGTLCYPNATKGSSPLGTAPYITPTGTPNPPPCIPDPVNGGNFELAPITPSWCQAVTQATGAKVVTLYTTYIMDNPTPTAPTDSQYYDWRVYYMQNYPGFMTSLQTNMAACATSSNLSFQATTLKDITTAVSSIFNSLTTAPLHLVK